MAAPPIGRSKDEKAFFATAARGTEAALEAELRGFGLRATAARGGAEIAGELRDAYRVSIESRITNRILVTLGRFPITGGDDLASALGTLPWEAHLAVDRTFAVAVTGAHPAFRARQYAAQKAKDAIVDRMRARLGQRPNVDPKTPDVQVHLHLDIPPTRYAERMASSGSAPLPPASMRSGDHHPLPESTEGHATVSIDLAGPLHRRGYRAAGSEAPLRETLAAAILAIAGWPDACPDEGALIDPMCGSGTLLVEAALAALGIAPGLLRRPEDRLSAWLGHAPDLHRDVVDAARTSASALPRGLQIVGSDRSEDALGAARHAARRAGVDRAITFHRGDLADTEPPRPAGLVVTNPPYGERLGTTRELLPLYARLGDVLKQRFGGYTAWVLTGDKRLSHAIGLRARSRHPLFNGPIDCRLLEYPLVAAKDPRAPGWRRPTGEAQMLENRLRKNVKRLSRWAKQTGVTCYRLYDADIPEYNVGIDWYDGAVRLEERQAPRHIDEGTADRRLHEALAVTSEVLGLPTSEIVFRVRARGAEHGRRAHDDNQREVREHGLRFLVNLEDYLDTGLFLDDRTLRAEIRERAGGTDFLNLFAYTCTATVAAAKGGARRTTSVDLSGHYLDWGADNLRLNGIDPDPAAPSGRNHRMFRADVAAWLEDARPASFDLVFVAPPTMSRSKSMRGDFDVQRDHAGLLRGVARVVRPGGTILFSVNRRGFELASNLGPLVAEDISARTIPEDFKKSAKGRHAFLLRR
jgi:23S rRNA (guanine2445-N2)-methyltransferase / 23S rRNA (guanine2069-N7)-methyltransferase